MKKNLFALLLGSVFLTGCAGRYVITLNNGNQIATHGKPRLENGCYLFKDYKDQPGSVPVGRVREVAPASMISSPGSSGY